MEFSNDEIKAYWTDFFSRTDYGKKLEEIADEYPDTRSLYVKFEDIENYNSLFSEDFLKNPEVYIKIGEEAIRDYIHDVEKNIHLRINQLPRDRRKEIRDE